MCMGSKPAAPSTPRTPAPAENQVARAAREEEQRLRRARSLATTVLMEEPGSVPGSSIGRKQAMGA